MKKFVTALVMTAALFSTAACGGEEATPAAPVTQEHMTEQPKIEGVPEQKEVAPVTDTEADIRKAIGVDESGYVTVKGVQCESAVIMTTPAMIDMYMEAGDMVALNPDSTIGVKVIGDPAICMQHFVRSLATL